MAFIIGQLVSKVATCTLVQVTSVTRAGTLDRVGYVDVHPLVGLLNGNNEVQSFGIITNFPYFRLQGGANAIILDPQVGDIGLALFASRDISGVKANAEVDPLNAESGPGSRRQYNMSDGLYIGGFLNGVPAQVIQFNTAGISVHSPTKVFISAPDVAITGNLAVTGDTVFTGKITANNKIIDQTHVHHITAVNADSGAVK